MVKDVYVRTHAGFLDDIWICYYDPSYDRERLQAEYWTFRPLTLRIKKSEGVSVPHRAIFEKNKTIRWKKINLTVEMR